MRQSLLFTKTRKTAPADETAVSAQLLIRGGYIHKEMAGVYDYLPLGLLVLKKIEGIIRDEMNNIGGQEVLMTSLQDPSIWKKTGRWDDDKVDNWFKAQLKNGSEVGFASTHEEPITAMLTQFIDSHKKLPFSVYQFQNKFRNELRAKSGIMRTREFIMKDMYSFSRTEEEFTEFYNKVISAYEKIFNRVGIGRVTYRTLAGGGSFSSFSDEFQTITDAGEDTIYIEREKQISVNKEFLTDPALSRLGLDKMDRSKLEEARAVEVGNVFPLGMTFSKALGLTFTDADGQEKPVIMGSYGIGLGRLMGTVVEVNRDEKGIIWPKEIAPYDIHLVALESEKPEIATVAEKIYGDLQKAGFSVLYDDRSVSAGVKFNDSDLFGIPLRLVVSERLVVKQEIEMKKRTEKTSEIFAIKDLLKKLEIHGNS